MKSLAWTARAAQPQGKNPSTSQGLNDGADEEGRSPDLMLRNYDKREARYR